MERKLRRRRGARWAQLEVEMAADDRLSICGSEGRSIARGMAKREAFDYWRSFFEENGDEMARMLREFGKRTPASAARFVLDSDGEFHGLDVTGPESGPRVDIMESGGQIGDELRAWFPEVAHWLPFHLNDMRPDCEHQEAAGWAELGREERTLYHWRIRAAFSDRQREIKKAAEERFAAGETVTATAEERRILALPYERTTHTPEPPADEYESKRPLYDGDHYSRASEVKARGWLRESEHPDGLLCKACPECGYRYGSEWKKREIPAAIRAEVDAFIASGALPALAAVAE